MRLDYNTEKIEVKLKRILEELTIFMLEGIMKSLLVILQYEIDNINYLVLKIHKIITKKGELIK